MRSARQTRVRALLIIGAAYAIYAGLFILRTSTLIGGVRYFALQDDEMISMRYAANLAHGYGLVWNPAGPRLEGYTNLLWVLYMTVFHLLDISTAKISLCIQVSGALFLFANVGVTSAITERLSGSVRAAMIAALMTALYYPLNNWALQGSEVGLLTLAFSTAIYLALAIDVRRHPVLLYAVLGVSTLARPDAAVFGFILLATLTVLRPAEWKRHVLFGLGTLGAFLVAQTAFRLWYFHSLLPNTYYLKLTGFPVQFRIVRGLAVFALFLISISPLAYFIARQKVFTRLGRRSMIVLIPVLGQALYCIYVGGDAWEWWGGANRYLAVVMPLVFVLAAVSLDSYCRPDPERVGSPAAGHLFTKYAAAAAAAVLVLASPRFAMQGLLVKPPHQTDTNGLMVRQALLIQQVTAADATVAVVWAGVIPYFAHRTAIDLLGKCDSTIAHEQSRIEEPGVSKWVSFRPGHNKLDYDYSVGRLAPDVVMQLWPQWSRFPAVTVPYVRVELDGFRWYVRADSKRFRWDVFRALGGKSEIAVDPGTSPSLPLTERRQPPVRSTHT